MPMESASDINGRCIRRLLVALMPLLFTLGGYCQKTMPAAQDTIRSGILQNAGLNNSSPGKFSGRYFKTDSLFSFRSPKGYFPSLFNNFTSQVSAPFHFDKKQWLITGISVGVTWFLLQYDDHIDEFARGQKQEHKIVADLSPIFTRLGGDIGIYSIIGTGLASVVFKDRKGLETSLLASQAVITSGAWVRFLKLMTGRERPFASYSYSKAESGRWYGPFAMIDQDLANRRPGSSFDSFPSGHTATAFSIASVVATQFKDQKAIPIISYSLASLVGLSRLTEHEHWASDVLVGALIGYACGKQVVKSYYKLHNYTLPSGSIISKNKAKLFITASGTDLGVYVRY
jgi:membrane-associated phospholipid phosphatase